MVKTSKDPLKQSHLNYLLNIKMSESPISLPCTVGSNCSNGEFSSPINASQKYRPESCDVTAMRLSVLVTEEDDTLLDTVEWFPRPSSFLHCILGKGLPMAVHERETLFPTKVVWFSDMSVILGKPMFKNEHLIVAASKIQNTIHRKQIAHAVCSRKSS